MRLGLYFWADPGRRVLVWFSLRVNMAQHFLLSASARSLSAAKIMRMSDNGVENVFLRLRWPHRRQTGLSGLWLHDLLRVSAIDHWSALALQGVPR